MQKFVFFIVFLGLISSSASMTGRNRDIERSIKEQIEDYYRGDKIFDNEEDMNDSDDEQEHVQKIAPVESWSETLPESDDFFIDAQEDSQEQFERSLKSNAIKNKHITLNLRALQKELAELKNNKGSRRYKELFRLYSNFLRDMEAAKAQQNSLDPNNEHPENGLQLPQRKLRTAEHRTKEGRNLYRLKRISIEQEDEHLVAPTSDSENELIDPPNNPDQQRIHITHRQLDSSAFSNRLQKSKKPQLPKPMKAKNPAQKTEQQVFMGDKRIQEIVEWQFLARQMPRNSGNSRPALENMHY
ncbi:MAG: hypothetical protein BWZ03_00355 [bacterium ADurb.BinA186]|nr:MAG: hypothetical protein BWZ03_00355 [bacterium ADurb.BinA186]